MKPKVAITGYGAVGKALLELFPKAKIYDPPKGYKDKSVVNKADFNFICVPTPPFAESGNCNTTIVTEILGWSKAEIDIIRSTVWPNYTNFIKEEHPNKNIIFMPEYGPSDFKGHPFNKLENVGWAILGGDMDVSKQVAELLRNSLYKLKIFYTDSTTAEITKLTENAFLYTKVIFFQQIYDLCEKYGVNFDELRLYLTEDPRINEDHSYVYPHRRKVSGYCLPKDMKNLIDSFGVVGLDPKLFKTLVEINESLTSD